MLWRSFRQTRANSACDQPFFSRNRTIRFPNFRDNSCFFNRLTLLRVSSRKCSKNVSSYMLTPGLFFFIFLLRKIMPAKKKTTKRHPALPPPFRLTRAGIREVNNLLAFASPEDLRNTLIEMYHTYIMQQHHALPVNFE